MGELASVTFVPAGCTVEVPAGTTVLRAATQAELVIPAPCGGRGSCGRCAVTVVEGELSPPSAEEIAALGRARVGSSAIRLSCLARVSGPVTLRPLSATVSAEVTAAARCSADTASASAPVVAGVDLGTTTIAARLVDSVSRQTLATTVVPNRQSRYGDDVLSRISAALEGASTELAHEARRSISAALSGALHEADRRHDALQRVAIAGNTAMTSLLAGAAVSGLAAHPFRHALEGVERLDGRLFGDEFSAAEFLLVPPVAAFVGGDLLAGMLATGMAGEIDGALLVDVGTNAEVAGVTAEACVVTSAPAGPAFEGWGIACGGRAGPGAIVGITASGETGMQPVSDGRATHLTGSGLIATVALLRRAGQLDAGGLLRVDGSLSDRLFDVEGVRAVSVCEDPSDRSVFVSQLDVRALQSAKAAVCVAIREVARAAGMSSGTLSTIIVAGAFGGAVRVEDLTELGIVPSGTHASIEYQPDAVVRGAAEIALEPALMEDARRVAMRARHVDLASGSSFTQEFLACTRLEPYSL